MQLYSNEQKYLILKLARDLIFQLCDLKQFQMAIGNKDRSTTMRKEFNKDKPFRIKS